MTPSELPLGRVATASELSAFARRARLDGRRLVVAALVADANGRIFVQRRSETRALFPGCWDVVGGHAEAGEGVREALEREVAEETGWDLLAVREVVEVLDWEAAGEPKREIDVLVEVIGDLTRPRLEAGKHSEGRWLARDELPLLLERRDPDDRFIHRIVAAAFAVLAARAAAAGGAPEPR